ncbi:RHS repeat protein [Paenibacillus camerounensis]|uniref:RHS repeat protein n=1 Tax=Paenibacillus camerounensis TaxID=1243663 RepID=UPI0005A8B75D|nr:RHS repeat protein [Paenibacillus camerounensis]
MIKKVALLALSSTLLFGNLVAASSQTSKIQDTSEYSIEWSNNSDSRVITQVTVDGSDYSYTYSNNNNRLTKVSEKGNSIYSYNEQSLLIEEHRNNDSYEYIYDSTNDLIGFKLNGIYYGYIKDDDLNVIAIVDTNGIEIVRYEYDSNGKTSSILGKDTNGAWIDQSQDPNFIGNLNLIRLHSFYYDIESGLYYNGDRYYDSQINEYIVSGDTLVTPFVSQAMLTQISQWRTSLMQDSNFGKSISYSSNWYSGLSDVELLSRLIYAENTSNSADQNAVTWVLINRKLQNSSEFGGGTYRGVATKSGAFEPITGSSSGTTNARVPNTSSSLWSNAVWNACVLLTTSSTTDYADIITKPPGISNQLFFVGLSYFLTGVSQDVTPVGSGIKYSLNGGSTFVPIKNIVIVFSSSSSFQNPTSRSAITSHSSLDTASERATHNIFFNLN